ncbi:MAG: hypothetical protein ACOC1Z_04675 [Cyanobacteriota bacterium]
MLPSSDRDGRITESNWNNYMSLLENDILDKLKPIIIQQLAQRLFLSDNLY